MYLFCVEVKRENLLCTEISQITLRNEVAPRVIPPMKRNFGQRLADLMDARHLSQRQFAAKAGISLDAVRRARQMKTVDEMRPTTFQAVAAALNLSVEQLHAAVVEGDGQDLPPGSPHDPTTVSTKDRDLWFPMIGKVAAGKPTDFELNVLADKNLPPSLYLAPQEWPATIIAEGDSMSP
jgi:transcriptional regulator with XRE-family HTH domain